MRRGLKARGGPRHPMPSIVNRGRWTSTSNANWAGYQVSIHAIGDAANHQVLDAFEAAYRRIDGRALRNRVEHAQVVAVADNPAADIWKVRVDPTCHTLLNRMRRAVRETAIRRR